MKRDGAEWEQTFARGKPTGGAQEASAPRAAPARPSSSSPTRRSSRAHASTRSCIAERLEAKAYLHGGLTIEFARRGGRHDGARSTTRTASRAYLDKIVHDADAEAARRRGLHDPARSRTSSTSTARSPGPRTPASACCRSSTAFPPRRAARTRTASRRASPRRCATTSRCTTWCRAASPSRPRTCARASSRSSPSRSRSRSSRARRRSASTTPRSRRSSTASCARRSRTRSTPTAPRATRSPTASSWRRGRAARRAPRPQQVQRKSAISHRLNLPGQARRLQLDRSGGVRALHRRGRLRRRLRQAGPRPHVPGDPAAARQGAQHRAGVDGQGARRTRSSPTSSRRSAAAPARTSTPASCATTRSAC